jgi:putative proteasome-type protease
MTYCLGIMTREGLVMASDSRTNAGYDQVNVCRKMHTFVLPGERAFDDFQQGRGLALADSMYMAARVVGDAVRRVSDLDRAALERDDYNFNIHLLLGGQVKGGPSALYCIYPQGNPLSATQDSPYLQIGEVKYGRPILDRGIVHDETPLDVAALYAMLSFDATIRSNVTVGPPLELLVYRDGALDFTEYRRFSADDPELVDLHSRWEATLRRAVQDLPRLRYTAVQQPLMETAARP